jgi:hypothetical protein
MNVAASVVPNATDPSKARRRPARETLALEREKWRICRERDDDRAALLVVPTALLPEQWAGTISGPISRPTAHHCYNDGA